MESGGPGVLIRVYEGDSLLGESVVKRNSEKRIAIDLQVDSVTADLDEHPVREAESFWGARAYGCATNTVPVETSALQKGYEACLI